MVKAPELTVVNLWSPSANRLPAFMADTRNGKASGTRSRHASLNSRGSSASSAFCKPRPHLRLDPLHADAERLQIPAIVPGPLSSKIGQHRARLPLGYAVQQCSSAASSPAHRGRPRLPASVWIGCPRYCGGSRFPSYIRSPVGEPAPNRATFGTTPGFPAHTDCRSYGR